MLGSVYDRNILRFCDETLEEDTEMAQSIADPHYVDEETEAGMYLSIGRPGIRNHTLGDRLTALTISP